MADNILSRYGMGYVDPRLTSDSEDATTYNVLASMPEKYRVPAVESDPKKWGSTGDVMAHLDRNVLHRYGADMPAMIGDFVDAAHEIGSAPLATPHYVDPALTRQMMEHAASVVGPQAGVALGRGMMTHAPAGTTEIGMFAGRNAKTADHAKLAAAEWAESRGASREAIHKETGWFRGADGQWRFEIPDNAAKMTASRGQFGDAFHHPELFRAYPDLANARLAMDAASGGQYEPRGARPETISIGEDHYRRYPGTIPPESVALHEAQHGIQGREGFATGANGADAHYLNSAGETEARAVQSRRYLTPEQRAARPPWLDYDVPEGQQIIRYGEQPVAASRSVDSLGYYSQALESAKGLRQAKGTPEQMLAQIKSAGVKDAEIEATGLREALAGKKSVTRDEIVSHLEQNKLALNESKYGGSALNWGDQPSATGTIAERLAEMFGGDGQRYTRGSRNINDVARQLGGRPVLAEDGTSVTTFADGSRFVDANGTAWDIAGRGAAADSVAPAKWARYSLDPSNPTYRETVLHLPGVTTARDASFQSGHFSEPNIVGHMMTSMTEHQGKSVYTIDQIQSDWGQKLRDGGVRDEAKIARLANDLDAAVKEREEAGAGMMPWDVEELPAARRARLLEDEYKTAETAAPGHPLVNTTDQWTQTTLRRAIRQAAEANADYIAIPSGKTVLGYNPGDAHGMNTFYDKIVPKNLGNILKKIDPASAMPTSVPTLDSPSGKSGLGQGFQIFPLTDNVKKKVKDGGLPLFSEGIGPQGVNARRADDPHAKFDQTLSGILKTYGLR